MTSKLAGALVAGALAIGILVGAAGTVVVHDVTGRSPGLGDMDQMMETMGMMDGGGMLGRSVSPADHVRHHAGDR